MNSAYDINFEMIIVTNKVLLFIRLFWLWCFVIVDSDLHGREVEVYLGSDLIATRDAWSIPSSTASTLDVLQANEMKQYLKGLTTSFKRAGGYDLLGQSSYIRWAWLSSKNKTWMMQIPYSSKDRKAIENSLFKAGWERKDNGVFVHLDLIALIKDELVLVGHKLELGRLIEESGYWSIPASKWFQVRAFKPMFEELARRKPRLDALLEYLSEIDLLWLNGDLVADIQLTASDRATALVISANAGIQFVKNLIISNDGYKKESWHLLDFKSYSQQSVNSKAIEHIFDRIVIRSYGKVLQIKYLGVGDFGKFLAQIVPKQLFSILFAFMPQYSKYRDQLVKLIGTEGAKGSQSVREQNNVIDSCSSEMKMIMQAVEFYNLDHLKRGTYEQIKPKLFEEGYLPEDLTCDGKLVKNFKIFSMGANGTLIRNSEVQ